MAEEYDGRRSCRAGSVANRRRPQRADLGGEEMEKVVEAARPEGDAPSLRARAIRMIAIGEVGVIAALLILVLLFYALQPAFLSERNIRAILQVVSFVGIIAIGQTMLL